MPAHKHDRPMLAGKAKPRGCEKKEASKKEKNEVDEGSVKSLLENNIGRC